MAFTRTKIILATLNNYLQVTAEMTDQSVAKSLPQLQNGYYPLSNSAFQVQYAEIDNGKTIELQVTNVIITNNLGSNKCIITNDDLSNERVILQGEPINLFGLIDFLTKNTGA